MVSQDFLQRFSGIVSAQFIFMIVIIALILILYDSKSLAKMNFHKESKMAKISGIVYLFLGLILFIITRFI